MKEQPTWSTIFLSSSKHQKNGIPTRVTEHNLLPTYVEHLEGEALGWFVCIETIQNFDHLATLFLRKHEKQKVPRRSGWSTERELQPSPETRIKLGTKTMSRWGCVEDKISVFVTAHRMSDAIILPPTRKPYPAT
ncbi:hypothetical protein DY000_02048838 [Brassica cretica]|uniref:Uncharacterized protein n=1 Tax=Brassica cretica TaxID=69181 RepID=A0ABQ7F2X6_BRACR|nr:hypothetical protein DY000_02048838 [Brassica cretica]